MELIKFLVSPQEENLRLDRLLKRIYPGLSQNIIEKSLRKNLIKVNDKKNIANFRVSIGEEITIAKFIINNIAALPQKKTPFASNKDIRKITEAIIYMDSEIIVVNKPSGLAVQGGSRISTSIDLILESLKFDYEERPKLVHRLDKDTSGILLIARTSNVAAKLSECFRNHTIEKYYWAIVIGKPAKDEGKITSPIRKKIPNIAEVENQYHEAITYYKIKDYAHHAVSWLEMLPITGRTHQLRIHAQKLGTPIIGDKKYGPSYEIEGLNNKLHLHARKIIIKNFPGIDREFIAPIPEHIKQTFDFFGFN